MIIFPSGSIAIPGLIITDKYVVITSINLNKINLGFHPTKKFWRENTETIYICTDSNVIADAKSKYLKVFEAGFNVEENLADKLGNMVGKIFTRNFQLKSKSDVKKLFAKLLLKKQLDVKKFTMKIGKITKQLMDFYDRTLIRKQDFVSAVILYHLTERKQDKDMIQEKVNELDSSIHLDDILNRLQFSGLVEKEGDYFKICLDTLLGDGS